MPFDRDAFLAVFEAYNRAIWPAQVAQERRPTRRCEASHGSFMGQVALPSEVDAGHTEAKMSNGVLEIRLPKTARSKAKTIKVT